MSDKSLFRRNLIIIVGLHVLLVAGLFFSGFFSRNSQTATWVEGGGPPASPNSNPDNSEPENTPPDESSPTPEMTPEDSGTSAPSMIVLGTPPPLRATPTPTPRTPKPTPTPTPATPKPTKTPKPATPTPSVTPHHSPKPSPSKSPKKKPSASPKPSAKKSASPKTSPKHSASPSASKTPKPTDDEGESPSETQSGSEAGSGTEAAGTNPEGSGGGHNSKHGARNGAEDAAQINWYLTMIHDRLYARWQQPASIVQNGQNLVTTIKIRIEKDGHVSNVTLEKSSGNTIMDDSVMEAARRLQQIDPLPSSIHDSFYDVPIDIELTPN